jgi:hypothetical protein
VGPGQSRLFVSACLVALAAGCFLAAVVAILTHGDSQLAYLLPASPLALLAGLLLLPPYVSQLAPTTPPVELRR